MVREKRKRTRKKGGAVGSGKRSSGRNQRVHLLILQHIDTKNINITENINIPHGSHRPAPLMSSIILFLPLSHHAPSSRNYLGSAQQRIRSIQSEIPSATLPKSLTLFQRTSYTSPSISPISMSRQWTILSPRNPSPSRPQPECESQFHCHHHPFTASCPGSDKEHQKEYDFEIKFFDEIVPEVGFSSSFSLFA